MSLSALFQYPKTKAEKMRHIAILLFLTAASGIFFINKPFHIDDPHWRDLGNRFLDIKSFYSLPYYIFGERLENIFSAPHPPLISFFHYAVIRLFPNPSEAVFHAVFLGFSMLAVTFVYQFCLRFSRYPFFIALCVLFSPPFFILSQSLMTDTALCGFLAGSLVFFIRAVDQESKKALAAAVALFALAIGVGFQAVVFYAAFFLYCFLNPPRRFSYFFVMGLSALPVLLWFAYHFIQMEQWPSPIDTSLLDPLGLRAKLLYFISQLSLAFLAPIGLIVATWDRNRLKTALAAAVIAGLIFGSLQDGVLVDYSTPQRWIIYVSGFFTVFFLARVLADMVKLPRHQETAPKDRNDFLFLSLTTLIFLPICAAFTPFAASRYLLPIIPFVYVLIPRMAAKLRPAPAAITLMICIVSSFLAAQADYNLASFYKKLPEDAAELMPEKSRTWFNGEWGFRHYMKRAGYRYLTRDADLKERDFIIEPNIPARMALSAIEVPLRLKRELAYPGDRIKTLHHRAHAGFWSQGWGLLPFGFTSLPLERIKIYEVMPTVVPFNLLGLKDGLVFAPGLRMAQRKLGGEVRETATSPGFVLSFTPDKTYRLQFGVGLAPGAEAKPAEARFQIYVDSAGTRSRLFQHNLRTGMTGNAAVWHDAEIDLEKFKAHPIQLTFEAAGDFKTTGGEVFWTSLNLVETATLVFR